MTKQEKKIITKAKWVDTALVRSHHKIAICTSESDFKFELKRLNVPVEQWAEWLQEDNHALTHFFEGENNGEPEKIVIITIRPNQKEAVSYLIHEAVHIFQQEMRYIQEAKPSDEMMAYSIEAIATNLINGYLEKPKNVKRLREK